MAKKTTSATKRTVPDGHALLVYTGRPNRFLQGVGRLVPGEAYLRPVGEGVKHSNFRPATAEELKAWNDTPDEPAAKEDPNDGQ